MQVLVAALVTGVISGVTYGLMGLFFGFTYRVTHFLNLTLGQFVMLGALSGCALVSTKGWNLWLAIAAVALLCGSINASIYLGPIAKWMRSKSVLRIVVLTFGLSLVVEGIAIKIWGNQIYSLKEFPGVAATYHLFYRRAAFSGQAFYLLGLLILIILGVWLLETKTRLGWSIRAIGKDQEMATTFGIRTETVITLTFFAMGALAGVLGMFIVPIIFVTTTSGVLLGLKGLVAAVVGGISGRTSAVIGGLFVGVLEQLVAAYVGVGWENITVFGALILMLLVRPTGIISGGSH